MLYFLRKLKIVTVLIAIKYKVLTGTKAYIIVIADIRKYIFLTNEVEDNALYSYNIVVN